MRLFGLSDHLFKDPYNSKVKIAVRIVSSVILLISFVQFLNIISLKIVGLFRKNILYKSIKYFWFIGSLIFLVIFIIPASSLSFNFSWLKTLDLTGNLLINSFNVCKQLYLSYLFFFKKFFKFF